MALWRNPTALIFVDEDNQELTRVDDATLVPRVGEHVQLNGVPHLVERVGYDVRARQIERVLVVCVLA